MTLNLWNNIWSPYEAWRQKIRTELRLRGFNVGQDEFGKMVGRKGPFTLRPIWPDEEEVGSTVLLRGPVAEMEKLEEAIGDPGLRRWERSSAWPAQNEGAIKIYCLDALELAVSFIIATCKDQQ